MHVIELLPRFRQAHAAVRAMAERETWDSNRVRAFQLARLNEIWSHAISSVPYYRDLYSRLGLPERFGSLDQFCSCVPVLEKAEVKKAPRRFLSERPRPGRWHYTGGSTGTPMAVYWEKESYLEVLRCKYRFHELWGVGLFDRTAFLWGHGASFAPGWRGRIARMSQPVEDRLRNRLRLSAYSLAPDDLDRYLEELAVFRPALLYGYSSAVYLLARHAAGKGTVPGGLKAVICAAEALLPEFVSTIEEALGAPALSEYGSIELGLIACEDRSRTLRVREDTVLVETIPDGLGRYRIVCTNLKNPSFPLLRYDIGDLTDEPLGEGSGFHTIGRVLGRDNDCLYTTDGHPVHPEIITHILEHHTAIRRFQARQTTAGEVVLQIETNSRERHVDPVAVGQQLSRVLKGYAVNVQITDAIPPTVGGKHRWIVSELQGPVR